MNIYLNHKVVTPTKVLTVHPITIQFLKESDNIIEKALKEGIITKVDNPTDWCSPAFFVQKPGGGLC